MTDFETIVVALVEANKKWPELRFTQVLQTLDINWRSLGGDGIKISDNFYDEDVKVLKRIEESIERLSE